MYLTMSLMLAFASIVLEAFLVWNIPAIHRFYTSGKAGRIANAVNSVLLSFALGTVFGAEGLVAMSAAMISTMISISGLYDGLEWVRTHMDEVTKVKQDTLDTIRKGAVATRDIVAMIYGLVQIVTWPMRMLVKLSQWYQQREPIISSSDRKAGETTPL